MVHAPLQREYDVIVVGGGPAGSSAAALLAQHGRQVLVVERSRFPRHHIGESTLLSIHSPLRWLGVADKVAAAGFRKKTGGSYIWGTDRVPWSFHFSELEEDPSGWRQPYSYQVERDAFDQILLDHARDCGATVLQGVNVKGLVPDDSSGVRGVSLETTGATLQTTVVQARVVIDASGQSCLSGRRFGWRRMHDRLRNSAMYGYWSGGPPQYVHLGGDLTPADHSNILICSTDFGWIWIIPLRGGRVSIGAVLAGTSEHKNNTETRRAYYDLVASCAELTPVLKDLVPIGAEPVRHLRDWSYRCSQFSRPGLLLAGDAACFVDPILSTGLHLALRAGISAACAANSILNGQDQQLVRLWYDSTYRAAYEQYEQMALWWYHGDRNRERWFERSRCLINREQYGRDLPIRRAFVALAAGMEASNYVEEWVDEWAHPLRMVALFHTHASFNASLPRLREKFGISDGVVAREQVPSKADRREPSRKPMKGPRVRDDAVLSVVAQPERARVRMFWEVFPKVEDYWRMDVTDWEIPLRHCDGTRSLEQIGQELGLGVDDRQRLHGLAIELERRGLLTGVTGDEERTETSLGSF
jgi:halogenation protein CepH